MKRIIKLKVKIKIDLPYVRVESYSHKRNDWRKHVTTIRDRNLYIDRSVSVGGDAPKEFIRVYEYKKCRRANRKKWSAYIAKVGHKWYPIESITEHLLNRIGEQLGLNIAKSKLAIIGNQLYFLSEYFLKDPKSEELVHGADIYAGYLLDKELVEEIEVNNMARKFFTFQFTKDAIYATFPLQADDIIRDLVRLIFFDAVVGNNDRHFYNWAVIRHIENKRMPRFSPIYDTARALFWNLSEENIKNRFLPSDALEARFKKYVFNSMPKIGWEGSDGLNHFELVKRICETEPDYIPILREMIAQQREVDILNLLKTEFKPYFTPERIATIAYCLQLRIKELRSIVGRTSHT